MITSSANRKIVIKEIPLRHKIPHRLGQLLYTSLTVLLFSACSSDSGSDNSESDYYFKAALDGRDVSFYMVNFQGGGNDSRFEMINVGGFEKPFPSKAGELAPPSLDFEIWKIGGDITPGTYSTPQEPEMVARYAVQTAEGTILYSTRTADDIFTVKIESISKSGIKGTFSGKVRNMDTGKVLEITQGRFNLPYEDIVNP